ncbi:HAD family hydrolase [Desulfuromonas acetoxidans]|uniref:HAD family hydrolase n=1 Tax=Desulfuromonas acetoxidans TaxID=891 RepID=UPI002931E6B1|nr:HAD family hydrolase [Desulfuromonas acetoxidans]
MSAECRVVVFDCDGVMVDSRQANLAYYNVILRHFGEPEVDTGQKERAHLCHTGSSPQVFAGLLGEERLQEALSVASQVDYDQFIPQLKVEPGLREVLAVLAEKFPLAIATNRGSSMPRILEHFDLSGYFSEVVTHQDVARPKPFPDMLLEVARRLNVAVRHMTFIGDSELDLAAAQRAGCHFIAYQWEGGQRMDHHLQLPQMIGH